MTSLVRLYIKTSFVFLLLGLLLGGYVTVVVNLAGRAVPWPLITAHVHLLLVGFMLTLVFGVATWMFPRPARDDARYRPGLAWLVYWLLTASTVVRMRASWARPWRAPAAPRWPLSADWVSSRPPSSSWSTCGRVSACPEASPRRRLSGRQHRRSAAPAGPPGATVHRGPPRM